MGSKMSQYTWLSNHFPVTRDFSRCCPKYTRFFPTVVPNTQRLFHPVVPNIKKLFPTCPKYTRFFPSCCLKHKKTFPNLSQTHKIFHTCSKYRRLFHAAVPNIQDFPALVPITQDFSCCCPRCTRFCPTFVPITQDFSHLSQTQDFFMLLSQIYKTSSLLSKYTYMTDFVYSLMQYCPCIKCTNWTHSLIEGQSSEYVPGTHFLYLDWIAMGANKKKICLSMKNSYNYITPVCSYWLSLVTKTDAWKLCKTEIIIACTIKLSYKVFYIACILCIIADMFILRGLKSQASIPSFCCVQYS